MCPMRLADSDPDRIWQDMDPALFRRIAAEVFPSAWTVGISCGAEPLCNPRFFDHLAELYRADVPVREMITNGTLLSREKAILLLETPPTSLFVSIDGASPATHAEIRGGCDLGAVMENIRFLSSERDRRRMRFPMISFSVTLQRRNLDELEGILYLAAGVGAASVATVPLVSYEGLDRAGEVPDPSRTEAVMRSASGTASRLGVLLSSSPRASRQAGSPCPYVEGWVYIDPSGLVNPCPYWNTANPLGSLATLSFRDVMASEGYRSLRASLAEGRLEGNCALCPEIAGAGRADIPKQ